MARLHTVDHLTLGDAAVTLTALAKGLRARLFSQPGYVVVMNDWIYTAIGHIQDATMAWR